MTSGRPSSVFASAKRVVRSPFSRSRCQWPTVEPFLPPQYPHLRTAEASGFHQFLLKGLVDPDRTSPQPTAGVRDLQAFEQPLQLAVFPVFAVQREEGQVHQLRQFRHLRPAADPGDQGVELGIAQLAQAFQVYLKGMRRGRQSLHRRIEVADGAFVHIGPIEQDEIPIAVDKDRNGLEQRLVEVVVHGAPSRKGDLPFPRGPAEEDADLNEVVGHALLFHW